jgi:hypothetical protein
VQLPGSPFDAIYEGAHPGAVDEVHHRLFLATKNHGSSIAVIDGLNGTLKTSFDSVPWPMPEQLPVPVLQPLPSNSLASLWSVAAMNYAPAADRPTSRRSACPTLPCRRA